MNNNRYLSIIRHYESCLEKYGDCHKGVDWPNKQDARIRYWVMAELLRLGSEPVSLLDFGCGAAHLYEYLVQQNYKNIRYSGLELSSLFFDLCKNKYPELTFYRTDLLEDKDDVPVHDYVIANGVFTEKMELSFDQMFDYFSRLVPRIFLLCRRGIAFNVMSKAVDWERKDLFHMPTDLLINFLAKNLSRHFVIRNDYGLYEYTVYVYREALDG